MMRLNLRLDCLDQKGEPVCRCTNQDATPISPDTNLAPYYSNMDKIIFSQDDHKAADNLRKHGVSLEEAATVFIDGNARLLHDPDHSNDEDRFILLGLSSVIRLLVVCHAYRREGRKIRIISPRKANKQETKQYRGFI